ncbi:MAG: hypothetical protein V2B18_20525 [Pseudomonadota bacterium]
MGTYLFVWFAVMVLISPVYANEKKGPAEGPRVGIVGKWEITQTKEPGKPYRTSYKGRPFVSVGPNAYTLLVEYNNDGTFRRVSRLGQTEKVHTGKWNLNGHELRHLSSVGKDDEVIYVRFEGPDRFTLVEVYENTPDPGLFATFKRVE